MMPRTPSLLAAAGLALLLTGALAACATPAATDAGSGGSSTPTPDVSTEIEVDAAWLDGGRMIGLVTQGSSTCIPSADAVTLSATGVLEVTFVDPDTACTKDLVPRVTLVELPEGVDPSQELEITVTGVGYHGDADLDGVAGLAAPTTPSDGLPSAGWTGEDGQFVVLTWGSGSCRPVVEDVAVVAPDAVTVTFVTPPEDQACTMDFTSRGVIVDAAGLDDDAAVQLTLAGGGPEFATPVTIPIVG